MQNEYYYVNELEAKMEEFIEEESVDHPFGYLPDYISRRMAEAAFAVLKNAKELNDFMQREDLLK